MPDTHALTPEGLLLIANGVDPCLVWDGLGDVQPAGLLPPTTALTFGGLGVGTLTGTYYAYTRFLDARGSWSNLSPLAGPVSVLGSAQIGYANVPLPTQVKVTRRQILRNTDGQTAVFYVDVDVNDTTSTSFTSTLTDDQLATQVSQALLDDKDNILANGYDPPPDHRSVIAHHLGRMFGACEIEYIQGSVSVTLGSKSVQGIGTEWPSNFAGRFLYVDSATQSYEIKSVDPVNQTLTLLAPYASATSPYASYCVRPAPALRRLVYYSQAGLPEAWPVTQALSLQEDGDEITGLMPKGSFIYFLERRHIYRFTFQSDPATDGYVFLSSNRGCVNNRCWVVVDQNAYLMDEAGVHAFSGGQEVQPLSAAIQDLFEPENAGSSMEYKINWAAKAFFHASYHPGQNVVRWFVALSGQDFPHHALCLELGSTRWWIEEYPVPIGANTLGRFQGEPRVFLGGPGGQVYLFGEGTLDFARPGPTLRGDVGSATLLTLTDHSANFTHSLEGAPVVIVSGRGRGQRRIVTNVQTKILKVSQPWLVLPDDTSEYQVGGIQWRYRSKIFRYHDDDQEQQRRIELLFEPCASPSEVEVRFYQDRSGSPVLWGSDTSQADFNGFATQAGDEVLLGDLTRANGFLQRRLDGQKDLYADGPRFVQVALSGVTNQDQVRIYQMVLDGAK